MPEFITPDGCRLSFDLKRAENATRVPPVVLLNGLAQTSLVWTALIRALPRQWPILCYDARGQGRSQAGRQVPTLALHASDLDGLLRHLKLGPVRLVGLSHGAHVALRLAVDRPQAAARLVLCSLGAERSMRSRLTLDIWARLLASGGLPAMARATLPAVFSERFLGERSGLIEGLIQAMVRHNRPEPLRAQLAALADYPQPQTYAAGVQCPVRVVTGADDFLVPPESAARLAEVCRGSCRQIPDCGHSLSGEAPQRLAAALVEFFGE